MIERIFGHWKTSSIGLFLGTLAAFVVFDPDLFKGYPIVLSAAKFVVAGGAAALGIGSFDPKKTNEPPKS